MSMTRFERHLLFTTVVILGTLLGHMTCGRASKFSIKSKNYSPTRSWAFFLLPGSMLGWVGSRTKQNIQYQSAQNSNVALVNNVDSQNMYKDQPRSEHTGKSQVPPLHKYAKLHKNTLLHSVWIIILIVLFIITAVVGIYYWLIFFPIMCKKERKYDVMQMSAKP